MAASESGSPRKGTGPSTGAPAGDAPGIRVEDEVEIRRELNHVFDFVSDGERLPAWMTGVKRAKRTSGPSTPDAGTTYRLVGKALGRRLESTYQLTAFEPGETFSSRMESRLFCVEQTYRFEEAGDGVTRVTVTGKALPLGRFKLLGPVLFMAVQRQVRTDHRKLKTVLERSKATAGARSAPAGEDGSATGG